MAKAPEKDGTREVHHYHEEKRMSYNITPEKVWRAKWIDKPLNQLLNIMAVIGVAAVAIWLFFVFMGWHLISFISGSMEPEIPPASLSISSEIENVQEYEVGDVMTVFHPREEHPITHRIIDVDNPESISEAIAAGNTYAEMDQDLLSRITGGRLGEQSVSEHTITQEAVDSGEVRVVNMQGDANQIPDETNYVINEDNSLEYITHIPNGAVVLDFITNNLFWILGFIAALFIYSMIPLKDYRYVDHAKQAEEEAEKNRKKAERKAKKKGQATDADDEGFDARSVLRPSGDEEKESLADFHRQMKEQRKEAEVKRAEALDIADKAEKAAEAAAQRVFDKEARATAEKEADKAQARLKELEDKLQEAQKKEDSAKDKVSGSLPVPQAAKKPKRKPTVAERRARFTKEELEANLGKEEEEESVLSSYLKGKDKEETSPAQTSHDGQERNSRKGGLPTKEEGLPKESGLPKLGGGGK